MIKYLLILGIILLGNICYSYELPFVDDINTIEDYYFTDYFRVVPADSMISEQSIKTKIWYDINCLYIYSECEIDDSFEQGTLSNKEIITDSDYLRYQVITDLKNYYSYTYYVFPLENKYDAIRNSDFSMNENWNSNYTYTSRINANIWKTITKIPFKDLRFFGNPPYNWKIILTRKKYRSNQYYSIPFLNTNMGKDYFRDALDIEIKKKITRSNYFSFRPYTLFDYDFLTDSSEFDENNFGIDLLFEPNFSSKIKLSFNPDFSDIPLDDEQDIYNSKYSPFYDENRFFFIEDINTLGVNNQLFYSRHINQPSYAFKFTSNSKNFTYGAMSTKDNSKDQNYSDDYFNIIAIKPVTEKASLQITLLNRINKDYHNEVLHLFPSIDISRKSTLWFDLNLSNRYEKAEENNSEKAGLWGKAGFNSYFKDYTLSVVIEEMSENYYMDMGRIYEDDFFGGNLNITYNKEYRKKIFEDFSSQLYLGEEYDNHTGNLLERIIKFDFSTRFYNIFFVRPSVLYVKERFDNDYFNKSRFGIKIDFDNLAYFQPGIAYYFVNTLIYKDAIIENQHYIQALIRGDLGRHFNYNITSDIIDYPNYEKTVYQDNFYIIFNSDLVYNFSNNLSLTSGIRFNNFECYAYSDHWGFYSNFNWEYKPNSYITIGYKNMLDKYEEDFNNSSESGYIKLSYQF